MGKYFNVPWSKGDFEFGFVANGILRLRYFDNKFNKKSLELVDGEKEYIDVDCYETDETYMIEQNQYKLLVRKNNLRIVVKDYSGDIVFSTKKDSTLDVGDDIRFRLEYDNSERIYGLGQDPMANLDQRNKERRMWQEWGGMRRSGNAGVPFYMSSKGYGLFLNSTWSSRFVVGLGEVAQRTMGDENRAPAPWPWIDSEETNQDDISIILDGGMFETYIILAPSYEEILKSYYFLTGKAPLFAKWNYGLMQSKFRYRSFEELLYVAREYRRRKIPCDTLIVDFGWFENVGDLDWNSEFDNAKDNIKKLNDMGFHVITAQHPFISENSLHYGEFEEKGYLNNVPEGVFPTYDFTNPDARKRWWEICSQSLYNNGVEGFWNDMGELEVHQPKTTSYLGDREAIHNVYSTYWAKSYYEGQRAESDKRVFNLMRTTYPGISRYGSVLWSGDISSFWSVLKDQIVVGQGVSLSGQPYWCTDIGGLFSTQELSEELMIRWFEYGVFCPIFRTHGRRTDTEIWAYGKQGEEIIKQFINLRYELIPYIYSLSWIVHKEGIPMIKPMCVAFPDDEIACKQIHQYMFGPAFLVAPVFSEGERIKRLYLPRGLWYDYWTDTKYRGGRFIEIEAPLNKIPLFVKAGSIVPYARVNDCIDLMNEDDITFRVYKGEPGSFELYEDDGKTYAYEKGEYKTYPIKLDKDGSLNIGNDLKNIKNISIDYRGESEIPSYEIEVDHSMKRDGLVLIKATIVNRTKDTMNIAANLVVETDFEIVKESSNLVVNSGIDSMEWIIKPSSDAVKLVNKAKVLFEINNEMVVEKELRFGSEYATRWLLATGFKGISDLNCILGPDRDSELPFYEYKGQEIYWKSNQSNWFDCLGYVPMPVADIDSLTISEIFASRKPFEATGYAKCKVYSKNAGKYFLELSGESKMGVWINNKNVFKSNKIVIKQIVDEKILLKEGWNSILVKCCLNELRPFSGREFGFTFRFLNENKEVEDSLLYAES